MHKRKLTLVLVSLLGLASVRAAESVNPADREFFEKQVRPLLIERCFKCHGGGELRKSGFDITSRAGLLAGGERGPAAVAGDPDASRMIDAIRRTGDLRMPPGRALSEREVAALERWVRMGLPWPAEPDADAKSKGGLWSLRPIEPSALPDVENEAWSVNPIDRFIASRLEDAGIAPADPTDKRTLIRRVTFDLTGLPPTPEEVDAFLADESPTAFERVVDRLLSSPHYGERWARHWLDLARYAESEGFKADETRPHVWRYRDYVIRSLNDDKPYDRFVREQIAGDELWPDDPDALVATAFNRHYPDESNARNLLQRRQEILNDITDTVGSVFLGLTVGCARCHDHKYDPITHKDYYRLQAFFAGVRAADDLPLVSRADLRSYREQRAVWEEKTQHIRDEMDALEARARESLVKPNVEKYPEVVREAIAKPASERTAMDRWLFHKAKHYLNPDRELVLRKIRGKSKERWDALQAELDSFAHLKPIDPPVGSGIVDVGRVAPATHVLSVGVYDKPLDPVEPQFLSALANGSGPQFVAPDGLETTGRRAALANWLVSSDNPLTARVIVNRIWHYHFGRGLVSTPSDFGTVGEVPTHPKLLDWLAGEFVRSGWRLKDLHRLILHSKTYQQRSDFRPDAAQIDPDNRLWWRFRRQRLEGEVIRDAALAVAGLLNLDMGGPSVFPELPPGMKVSYDGWNVSEEPEALHRRSIYVFVRRNVRYPLFEAFDMPDTHESCPSRTVTTTAPQALMMLNSELTLQWARSFAGRVLEAAGNDVEQQIRQAFRLAYAREPDEHELSVARRFFEDHSAIMARQLRRPIKPAIPSDVPEGVAPEHAAALVDFCHMLMNSNEFLYRS